MKLKLKLKFAMRDEVGVECLDICFERIILAVEKNLLWSMRYGVGSIKSTSFSYRYGIVGIDR